MSPAIPLFVSLLLLSVTTQLVMSSNSASTMSKTSIDANPKLSLRTERAGAVVVRGNASILSENRTFELGFFSSNGENWYLGIWYASIPIPTYVWVANRESPVSTAAEAVITADGKLGVRDSGGEVVWRTQNAAAAAEVRLSEEGNLVLLGGAGKVVWRSFDHPTDTWLPGMNLSVDQSLICWRSSTDPSPGNYSLRLKPPEYGEIELVFNGIEPYWSTGNWTGTTFSGVPEMTVPYIYRFRFTNPFTPSASFGYTESPLETGGRPPLTRFQLAFTGQLRQFTWSSQAEYWNPFWSQPENPCKVYRKCGNLGFCNPKSLNPCQCLPNFQPSDAGEWFAEDFSGGCRRDSAVVCGGDGGNGRDDGFEEVGAVSFDGAETESVPGNRAGGGGSGEKWFFPPWAAHQIIEGNMAAVVDERLAGAYDTVQAERLGLVAVWCIQDEEAMRPTMGMVVKMLEGVVEVNVPPPPKLLQALVSGESFHGVGPDSGNGELTSGGCSNDNVQVSGNSPVSLNHLSTAT
ncbi:G-type lectin S-receptor-like serine/threonine-protein kinase SD2-2 [Camellia lanceoleosa]|uniref:G-type lectin S-receptor-like serine/threonine-protein kinase SD2-2 n=1 Tax=Camellia lanceoleosa TaxID=1840588 RepID=A0ACC0IPM4_9ERIC|nr:G-type lectin S-receptor-like serine/threonine-protein kinase SD2-2 [Camellia lanceoleosa]